MANRISLIYSHFFYSSGSMRSPLTTMFWGLAIASSTLAIAQIATAQTATAGLNSPASLIPVASPALIPADNAYTLGGGDTIRIDIFDVPEFSGANGQYAILADGSLNLPWIGKVSVQGLTLEQAAQALAAQYTPYINDPLITVTLLASRPLRIGIIGQVNRPGVYTVSAATGGASQKQTVTLAIQSAGGITQIADVQNIQVRRPHPTGTEQIIPVNIWNFLQTGDLAQDVELRDGDTVVVPEAIAFDPAETSQLAASNLSPTTISVNVVGEVMRPGAIALPPNVSLNQALLAAGGFNSQRARRSRVTLIRLHPDGSVTNRSVAVDFTAGINEETNPPLHSSDIVMVGRSTLASTSDFLGTLLSPLNGVFSIFRVLDGLGLTGGSSTP
jgi:polysaccharide export outer membrane protein